MNQDKVTVKMNFCINPVMAEHLHIGGEWTVRDGQTSEQAWKLAIERIELFYKENFPNSAPARITETQVDKPADKIDGWIQVIELASTITALEKFKPTVDKANDQRLTDAYKKQMKKLSV